MEQYIKDFIINNENNKYTYPPIPENLTHTSMIFNWIIRESKAPWLEITGINVPYAEMLAEARALKDMFVFHRDKNEDNKGWRSLAIHGLSAAQTNTASYYGIDDKDANFDWTEIQDRCPVTVKFFKEAFPYKSYARLRFMLLEPDGYINPHSDSVGQNLFGAVNISLNNPSGCRLVVEQGTLPFKDGGSIFMFNNHYHHAVYNESNTDRFHMIVHGVWNSKWEQLVVDSYREKLKAQ